MSKKRYIEYYALKVYNSSAVKRYDWTIIIDGLSKFAKVTTTRPTEDLDAKINLQVPFHQLNFASSSSR